MLLSKDATGPIRHVYELAHSMKNELMKVAGAKDLSIQAVPSPMGPHITLRWTHHSEEWGNVDSAITIFGATGDGENHDKGTMNDVDMEWLLNEAAEIKSHYEKIIRQMGARAEWEAQKK